MRLPAEWLAAAAITALLATAGVDLALLLSRADPPAGTRAAAGGGWDAPLPRRVIPLAEPSTPAPAPVVHHPSLAADSVAIPVQQVRAPIIDYCPIIDGGLEPPTDVHQVCYWAGGAGVDAQTGTTVLTGHVNWAGVTGAFGNLASLHRGDRVLTSDAHRVVVEWLVTRVEHRPKTEGIDAAAFVGREGPRRLFLISCGGAFDAAEASYVDNIYVWAKPVLPAPPPPPVPKPRPVE